MPTPQGPTKIVMNKELLFFPPMEIKKIDQSSRATEFIFEHLDSGLAATLGNAFRRILLTQVPGLAVFAVKISDKEKTIASEISKLQGVKEIPVYLIFHLKKLVFQFSQKEIPQLGKIYTLQINIDNSKSEEEYTVTGQDIKGELTIVNPETYLATVAPASQLKITLYCRYYYAFRLAVDKEQRALLSQEKNLIFLDSDYCPVKEVNLKVEQVVVDLNKQEERLILTITTNGGISAQDSLIRAVSFLEQKTADIQQQLVTE